MITHRTTLVLVGLILVVLSGCRSEDAARITARADSPSAPSGGTSPTEGGGVQRAAPATAEAPPTAEAIGAGKLLPQPEPPDVRLSVLAGSWYPGDREVLAATIDGYLDGASQAPDGHPIALISPHAGIKFSGAVAGHAYAALRGRTYGRVFVVGPSHHVGFHGVSVPNFTHYETPLGRVPLDLETATLLRTHPLFGYNEEAHEGEHSVEIQLPFLQRALDGTRWTFVPMLVGRMTPDEAADAGAWLRSVLAPGDLLVASSDFTHWGRGFGYAGPPGASFGPEEARERLPALMEAAWAAIRSGAQARFWDHKRETGDTICGFLPITMLLGAIPKNVRAQLRATDTSGAITGDWTRSVSYLAAQFSGLWPYSGVRVEPGVTEEEKDALLRLARGTVEAWIREGRWPTPADLGVLLTERLRADSGVFVTLKKHGRLRGCIGNIPPSKPLFQGVLDNSVNAASRDRRFPPVTPDELDQIEIEISVLTPPVAVEGPWGVVLGRHGVWIDKDGRSAVYLPQVAPEQGWTIPQTLTHLSQKAGLPPDAWTEGMTFRVMEAIVFAESRP